MSTSASLSAPVTSTSRKRSNSARWTLTPFGMADRSNFTTASPFATSSTLGRLGAAVLSSTFGFGGWPKARKPNRLGTSKPRIGGDQALPSHVPPARRPR